MKKVIFSLILVVSISSISIAQRKVNLFTNTQDIDKNRYEGVRGTPFLFKEWMNATIIGSNDSTYNDVKINYNAYEQNFEVLNNDKYISLDDKHYKQITVHDGAQDIVFKKNLNPDKKDQFYQVVYSGKDIMCFLDLSVGITENTVQDVGRTIVQKKFKADPIHHFKINGTFSWLRVSKKNITQLLGGKKEVSTYIKKNKLKVAKSTDLAKLLSFYESEVL